MLPVGQARHYLVLNFEGSVVSKKLEIEASRANCLCGGSKAFDMRLSPIKNR